MGDNNKRSNICVIGIPEGEKNESDAEKNFEEIITKNFLSLMKDINLHIQEAEQTPSRIHSKKSTSKHIIIKLLKAKDKENTLKAVREK